MAGAEFCEGCPMKGSVRGEIERMFEAEVNYRPRFGLFGAVAGDTQHYKVGAIVDKDLHPSEIIMLPSTHLGLRHIVDKIEACEKPIMKQEGIFRKRQIPLSCPAIGDLALDGSGLADPVIKERIVTELARHLLDVPLVTDQEPEHSAGD